MMTGMELREHIHVTIIRVLENMVPPETDIQEESTYDDLGLDSFHPIELAMELEEELDIFIEDNDIVGIESVYELIELCTKLYIRQK